MFTEDNPLIGKRIELVSTTDKYTNLTVGEFGTIRFVDDYGTIFVDWDNGSKLGMIPGVDKYRIIHD